MNKIEIKVANSNLDFVGIECENQFMKITFPIGYDIETKIFDANDNFNIKKYQNDILTLLKILEANKDSIDFDEGTYNFSFTAGIYLINDYFENGLVKSYNIINNMLNIGKIDWNKTIHNKIPIYDKGNFVYLDNIYKNLNLENDEITEIQLFCLHKAFLILGIFYNNYSIDFFKPMNKDEILYKIQNNLNKTNVDKERKRLSMMKKFIEGSDINMIGDNEIKIGTDHFNFIWENLLREKITFYYNNLNILPDAYYVKENEKLFTSSLRPDIVVSDKDNIYLVDAKYYQIGSLPQTSDIVKQLFYADYINYKKKNMKIKNIFLMPKNVKNQMEYYGYATTDSNKDTNGGKIATYYLDCKTVIESNFNIIECINDLVNQ